MSIELFKTRRSIKAYKSERLSEAELDAILEAGTYAPTGLNRQSPLIVAFRDPKTIKMMSDWNGKMMGREGDPFYGASTVVVVFADSAVNTGMEDACLVMGNLLNAAHSIGVGSCWVHRAREFFESEEGRALKEKMGIPERFYAVGNCLLGYYDKSPEKRPRKEGYIIKD